MAHSRRRGLTGICCPRHLTVWTASSRLPSIPSRGQNLSFW